MAAPETPFAAGQDNLWTKILDHNKLAARQPGAEQTRPDANLYFVGTRGGGKSTLLNRILYPNETATPKPTDGVEYSYLRKSAPNSDRKDVANIWEISGADELCADFTASENLFLGMRQVATAVVVIVLDLSKPETVLPTLEFWLNKVKTKLGGTFEKLERRQSKLPQQLKDRAKKCFGPTHEDRDAVTHLGVSVIVVANKYDTWRDTDAVVRKTLARTLRCYCHSHGAALLFAGGLSAAQPPPAKDAPEYKTQLAALKTMLAHFAFSGPDRKYVSKLTVETDHLKGMMVPSGSDKLKDIGLPGKGDAGGGGGGAVHACAEWRDTLYKLYPPPKTEPKKAAEKMFDQEAAKEAAVDALVAQKNAEVEAYKKQLETARVKAQLSARQAAKPAAPPPRK